MRFLATLKPLGKRGETAFMRHPSDALQTPMRTNEYFLQDQPDQDPTARQGPRHDDGAHLGRPAEGSGRGFPDPPARPTDLGEKGGMKRRLHMWVQGGGAIVTRWEGGQVLWKMIPGSL